MFPASYIDIELAAIMQSRKLVSNHIRRGYKSPTCLTLPQIMAIVLRDRDWTNPMHSIELFESFVAGNPWFLLSIPEFIEKGSCSV